MPWVVGIDEAGYGPNLGPLVQAAVALHLPEDDLAGWETLKPVVRRCGEKADGRLLIDDSKRVYTRHGLRGLERVGYTLFGVVPQNIESFLTFAERDSADDLVRECWFDGAEELPLEVSAEEVQESLVRFLDCYRAGSYALQFNIVPTPRFNQIVDQSDSKATVLAYGLIALMQATCQAGRSCSICRADDPVIFLCDKHGGRNFYAGMLQEAFPNG
ncbi:MAG TPA: hypothetical protein VLM40_04310, partial [Gemmata sp.]|nr:hypothetical protein [Gemmata sp.]